MDNSEYDQSAAFAAERDRLAREVSNLVDSLALGIKPETIAPGIRERELEIAKLDAQLRMPRPERGEPRTVAGRPLSARGAVGRPTCGPSRRLRGCCYVAGRPD
jgi:hypothetical protein